VPWKAISPVDERMQFVSRLVDGERMTDLCREFGISRRTGYKFKRRYEQLSVLGLLDQRRVPERIPHRTPVEVVELIVALRTQHPTWGPKKLRDVIQKKHHGVKVPASSTIGSILKRKGLVAPRRRPKAPPIAFSPLCHAVEPNDVWCIDFKGHFRLGNGKYCYPLTVTDAVSRYILACEGYSRIDGREVRTCLEDVFATHGLPGAFRFDGGAPFASSGVAGLSKLSVWWLQLGIRLERIEPGCPQQNGRHERMHRTLKEETTRPAAQSLLQQQERFDHFVDVFNTERPHEALAMQRPAEVYRSSSKPFSGSLPEPTYPLHDLHMRVTSCGHVRIPGNRLAGGFFLSSALVGHRVGLRELGGGRWLVSFLDLDLGTVDQNTNRFTPITPNL
jgi:transposase InsO family protein